MNILLRAAMVICFTAFAQTPAAQIESILRRGNEYERQGRLDEAARDFAAARDAAERAGNQRLLVDALVHLGYIRYYRGEMNQALVDLRRAYDLGDAIGHREGRRAALEQIAHLYADAKVAQYDRAIEYYRQLLAEYEQLNDRELVADTLYNLGGTAEQKGDLNAAIEWHRRALAAEEELGRAGEAAYVKRSIGIALVKLDRAAEALPLFDQALATLIERKDAERAAHVRQSRGIALRKLGRLDAAIADLEASRAHFAARNSTRFLEKSEDELALAYAAAGRWQDAFRARTSHALLQRELAEKLREEHTSRLRVQFDAERKEQENRALVRANAAAARIRRLQTIILILGGAIIAVLAYLAVRIARDARRMRDMAMTDELTRLPNRRHLFAAAEQALARGGPLSLAALDVDHFKRINDTWGHAAGDLVLQRVAHACRAALRPTDLIGRTGGEEFTVVLPSTTLAEALPVAERLRAAVEAIDCRDVDPSLRVTISVGLAEGQKGETLAKIAGRADEMLYLAKERGRNRVELQVLDAVDVLR